MRDLYNFMKVAPHLIGSQVTYRPFQAKEGRLNGLEVSEWCFLLRLMRSNLTVSKAISEPITG
jgi:hypothetical protein